MAIIVDAITATNLLDVVKSNIKNSRVVETTGGTVSGFVEAVKKAVGTDKMSVLRVWSHGWTHFSDGGDYPDGNVDFGNEDLSDTTIETFKPLLTPLAISFQKPARVELRGCAAAMGNGKTMMKKLAAIWQVEIHASDRSQHLVTLWQPPVWAATPDGKFISVKGIEVSEGR